MFVHSRTSVAAWLGSKAHWSRSMKLLYAGPS